MPSSVARYQSAGAVKVAIRSAKPATFISTGAETSTSVSITSASAQVVGVVRFTPLTSSTERSSAKPLTLLAVCTTT